MNAPAVLWATGELQAELRDCAAFRDPGDLITLADDQCPDTDDPHERHLWARRAHLRWHAVTGTGCPLQQQILRQLRPERFPEYFPRKEGHGAPHQS